MSRAASSSVLPDLRPRRLKPPVPRPATLTRRPVRPRVVYCIRENSKCRRTKRLDLRCSDAKSRRLGAVVASARRPPLEQAALERHLARVVVHFGDDALLAELLAMGGDHLIGRVLLGARA